MNRMAASHPNSSVRVAEPGGPGVAPLVEVERVVVDFQKRQGVFQRGGASFVRAVNDVSLSILPGQSLGLVGESGSGKSTIGRVAAGMLTPTSGTVRSNGQMLGHDPGALATYRQNVQIVFQDPYSSLDPRMRVGSIIAEPLLGRAGPAASRSGRKERVAELLNLVGLSPDASNMYPHQFSGGQRQRIALARALSSDPRLIILDEPTSALDVSIRAQILKLLKDLQKRLKVSYLVISHDLGSVAYLVSRVAVMYCGRIVEEGTPSDIYRKPGHPYTRMLLASVPREDASFISLDDLAANEPVAIDTGSGCPFRNRCDLRTQLVDQSVCDSVRPPLAAIDESHCVACHANCVGGVSGQAES